MNRFPLRAMTLLAALLVGAKATTQEPPEVRTTPSGIVVDFQDTDIRVVIAALAEAAGLNVIFADLPARRITLRLRQPVPPDSGLPINVTRFSGENTTESANALDVMLLTNSNVLAFPSRRRPKDLLFSPTHEARENGGSAATLTGAPTAPLRPSSPVSVRKKDASSNWAEKPPPRSSLPRNPR